MIASWVWFTERVYVGDPRKAEAKQAFYAADGYAIECVGPEVLISGPAGAVTVRGVGYSCEAAPPPPPAPEPPKRGGKK